MHSSVLFRTVAFALLPLIACEMPIISAAQENAPPQQGSTSYVIPPGTILRFVLSAPLSPARLKSGHDIEGELSRPVYVYDREVIPAGSHLHAVVGEVDKHKVEQKKGFIERLQSMRSFGLNRRFEYDVKFLTAQLTPPSGTAVPLNVRFVEAGEVLDLHTKGDQVQVGGTSVGDYVKMAPGVGRVESAKNARRQAQHYRHPEMSLETEQAISVALPVQAGAPLAGPGPLLEIPSGTHARLLLLESLSASENKQGDTFHACVLAPIFDNGRLLVPEGSTLEGHIGRVVPPRRLNRRATLYLAFDKLVLPNGASQNVAASLVGTQLDSKNASAIDPEGGLHGQGPGAKEMLRKFGIGLGAQQVADELAEIATHAAGPYVSIPMGVLVFIGGRGHDVELPRYSELEISFGRTVPIGRHHDGIAPPPQTAPQLTTPPPQT
jgi:hypothetical protein